MRLSAPELRGDAPNEVIQQAVRDSIHAKWEGHEILASVEPTFSRDAKSSKRSAVPNRSERADVSPPCQRDVTEPDGVAQHEHIARTRETHVQRSLSICLSTLFPVTPEHQGLKGVPAFRRTLWLYNPDAPSSVRATPPVSSGDIPKEFLCGRPSPSEPLVPQAHR